MFLVIEEPSSGERLMARRLAPNESLDCRRYADKYADMVGLAIDKTSSGYIYSFSGDIRVEIRFRREDSFHIWSGENFYFQRAE